MSFKKYQEFVNAVTSETSQDTEVLKSRIDELENGLDYSSHLPNDLLKIKFAKMDTACSGIAGEAGEINDLWKKIKYHGKPYNEENRQKMIDECGDMFWYMSHLMECLDIEYKEVLARNVDKLQSRYPGGEFSIEASENRTNEI